jgi:hypothetical protein
MASVILINSAPSFAFDWPSLAWTTILAGLTFSCLAIKARFAQVAAQGAVATAIAHMVIGYFGLGMMLFGASSAARAHFPVPGGAAWEGPIAVIGGIAAFVIGSTTLVEHALQVRAARREAVESRVLAR